MMDNWRKFLDVFYLPIGAILAGVVLFVLISVTGHFPSKKSDQQLFEPDSLLSNIYKNWEHRSCNIESIWPDSLDCDKCEVRKQKLAKTILDCMKLIQQLLDEE